VRRDAESGRAGATLAAGASLEAAEVEAGSATAVDEEAASTFWPDARFADEGRAAAAGVAVCSDDAEEGTAASLAFSSAACDGVAAVDEAAEGFFGPSAGSAFFTGGFDAAGADDASAAGAEAISFSADDGDAGETESVGLASAAAALLLSGDVTAPEEAPAAGDFSALSEPEDTGAAAAAGEGKGDSSAAGLDGAVSALFAADALVSSDCFGSAAAAAAAGGDEEDDDAAAAGAGDSASDALLVPAGEVAAGEAAAGTADDCSPEDWASAGLGSEYAAASAASGLESPAIGLSAPGESAALLLDDADATGAGSATAGRAAAGDGADAFSGASGASGFFTPGDESGARGARADGFDGALPPSGVSGASFEEGEARGAAAGFASPSGFACGDWSPAAAAVAAAGACAGVTTASVCTVLAGAGSALVVAPDADASLLSALLSLGLASVLAETEASEEVVAAAAGEAAAAAGVAAAGAGASSKSSSRSGSDRSSSSDMVEERAPATRDAGNPNGPIRCVPACSAPKGAQCSVVPKCPKRAPPPPNSPD